MRKVLDLLSVAFLVITFLAMAVDAHYWPKLAATAGLIVLSSIWTDTPPCYDVLALLPGWRYSEGAKVEKMVAEACGIEVVELGDAE